MSNMPPLIEPERVWRPSRDDILMENVHSWAKRTTCGRSQRAGAVIARDGRVVSTGYAGPPSKLPHCREGICDPAQPCTRTVHAELNSILYAARIGAAVEGCDLYCTLSPCERCADAIINCGIRRVIYGTPYRLIDGLELLDRGGIPSYRYIAPDRKLIEGHPGLEVTSQGRLVQFPNRGSTAEP